jgi:hypothetical protein
MKTLAPYALSVVAVAALLSGCEASQSLATTPVGAKNAAQPQSGNQTFYYAGHPERFVVPSGVTKIKVDAIGAAGAGYRYPKICYGPCFGRGGRIDEIDRDIADEVREHLQQWGERSLTDEAAQWIKAGSKGRPPRHFWLE